MRSVRIYTKIIPSLFLFFGTHTGASEWILENPQAISLRMDPEMFQNERLTLDSKIKLDPTFVKEKLGDDLEKYRKAIKEYRPDQCHVEGLATDGQHLFLSCCLYPHTLKVIREYVSRSFLLRARLVDIFDKSEPKKQIDWKKREVTEIEDEKIGGRIITRVMGHPSGIVYDPVAKAILNANAVYEKKTRGQFSLFDPKSLKRKKGTRPVPIADHLSLTGIVFGQYLISTNWGSAEFIFVESDRNNNGPPRIRTVSNPVRGSEGQPFSFNDCEIWDQNHLLCGGHFGSKTTEVNEQNKEVVWEIRDGRLFLIEFVGNDFESLTFGQMIPIKIKRTPESEFTIVTGRREYQSPSEGEEVDRISTSYGGESINRTLTNNGFAITPDRQYAFFVPNDVPRDKLIRFKLTEIP